MARRSRAGPHRLRREKEAGRRGTRSLALISAETGTTAHIATPDVLVPSPRRLSLSAHPPTVPTSTSSHLQIRPQWLDASGHNAGRELPSAQRHLTHETITTTARLVIAAKNEWGADYYCTGSSMAVSMSAPQLGSLRTLALRAPPFLTSWRNGGPQSAMHHCNGVFALYFSSAAITRRRLRSATSSHSTRSRAS